MSLLSSFIYLITFSYFLSFNRKTKAMGAIFEERQRRRTKPKQSGELDPADETKAVTHKKGNHPSFKYSSLLPFLLHWSLLLHLHLLCQQETITSYHTNSD
jgi:hypothetical protein